MGEISTSGWNKQLMSSKLVHISASPEDFARTPMAGLHLAGDLRTIFANLHKDTLLSCCDRITESPKPVNVNNNQAAGTYFPANVTVQNPCSTKADFTPLKPQCLMEELAQRLPEETRFLIDTGNAFSWATHYLFLKKTGKQRSSFTFGAMGWAIGAAIGTALANREAPVVCLTGDGSYLMSGQEITVAVEKQLPVIFAVLNDQAYGMIKHGQRLSGAEPIGFELPPVDFAMVAQGLGAQAFTIRSVKDFQALDIDQICNANKPTLLDIHIDPEEVPPIGTRVKTLSGMNKST